MEIYPNSIYEHYKGQRYRIIAIATFSEDISQRLVVYEALYANKVSQVWARPEAMFLEMVQLEGRAIPRFKLIEQGL